MEVWRERMLILIIVVLGRTPDWVYAAWSATSRRRAALEPGGVVMVSPDIAQLQTLQGFMVDAERLGPGIVQEIDYDGRVRVSWARADLETWSPAEDVLTVHEGQHIVTVLRCDATGRKTLLRHRLALIEHHWTIEIRPNGVVRAERSDGLIWTFAYNEISQCVIASWLYPPEDDDAEALTAAELAVV